MKKLSILDLAFLVAESENSPKHVAGLLLCKKPRRSPAGFARQLVDELKAHEVTAEPFNLVIEFLGWKGPYWKPCSSFAIDDHVFYHRPKKMLAWQDALDFVAGLHEPLLDRSRPLWEFHLVDGIKGGKFAVYIKMHHAYADGMTMASWIRKSLSQSADDRQVKAIWTLSEKEQLEPEADVSYLGQTLRSLTRLGWQQLLATGGMAKMSAQQLLERVGLTRNAVALPFSSKQDTPLTGNATPARGLATAAVSMERVKTICKATRSTLNHVALTCIDGALHHYLQDRGNGLDHPITIQMPVNLRKDGDRKGGNKIGLVLVDLAQPTDDPFVRLREIGFTLRNLRNQIDGVPGVAIEQYSIISAAASELIEQLRLSDKLPTNGYTLVSNVPGPRERLYLKGAAVEQLFPISALSPGLLMNITLFSYAGELGFGLVATRDLEHLDHLARYIETEFTELEQAVFAAA